MRNRSKDRAKKMDEKTFMEMFRPEEIAVYRIDGKEEKVISAAGLRRVLPLIGTQEADAFLAAINQHTPAR
ncbi:hypothetical protein [Brucella intermedia]|uniref:hypothetical protein n=1 Tax=Brucella intermedia TaxID=94625 RepID=UPI00224AE122|nr:hypothetical protein [Brucella intermedia]